MIIEKSKLLTLWMEDEEGQKHIPDFDEPPTNKYNSGFIYQHSMLPTTLRHNILKIVVPAEVEQCKHPKSHIKKTGGWVDGIEGRECQLCNGTQVKPMNHERPKWWPMSIWWPKIKKRWPKKWAAEGSRQIMAFESGWQEDLVLSMANTGDYTLSESILISATSCERCMNSLAHKYGLKWGYPEYSEEWEKTNTSCHFCETESGITPPIK